MSDQLGDLARVLLPPRDAIREQLRLLASQPGWREVSLWAPNGDDELHCEMHAGGRPSRGLAAAARQVASQREPTPPGPRRTLVAAPVNGPDASLAALAARVPAGTSADALRVLEQATPLIACALERRELLEAAAQSRDVVVAGERRLVRFGLDLHDGPAQSAAALLAEVRMFAGQLRGELEDHRQRSLLSGRVDDLELRAQALEAEVRELARAAGAPAVLEASVADALRNERDAFAQVAGVVPKLKLSGPLDDATASQRITLLRAVQEALRNIRQHSGAQSVLIRAEAQPKGIDAEIWDDGRGFDVHRALARAERGGRLGLSGIAARVRLLGGRCVIRSRAGGPTSVAISLPRWPDGAKRD